MLTSIGGNTKYIGIDLIPTDNTVTLDFMCNVAPVFDTQQQQPWKIYFGFLNCQSIRVSHCFPIKSMSHTSRVLKIHITYSTAVRSY
jgi:hypothetical protein